MDGVQGRLIEPVDAAEIHDFETGGLDAEQTISLFQRLVDSGQIKQLSDDYRAVARIMVENGQVVDSSRADEDCMCGHNPFLNACPSCDARDYVRGDETPY